MLVCSGSAKLYASLLLEKGITQTPSAVVRWRTQNEYGNDSSKDVQANNPYARVIRQQHSGFAPVVRAEHLVDGGAVETEEGAEEQETEDVDCDKGPGWEGVWGVDVGEVVGEGEDHLHCGKLGGKTVVREQEGGIRGGVDGSTAMSGSYTREEPD